MAACVLRQRSPRLCALRSLRRTFALSHSRKAKDEAGDQEGTMGASQPPGASSVHGGYRLRYNPPSHHQAERSSATSGKETCEDYWRLAPSLRLQSHNYNHSVNSSRPFSTIKNRLLHFNKDPDFPSSSSPDDRNLSLQITPDFRGFLKSRPEYASMRLDLTGRPDPISFENVSALLQKVSESRGNMAPSDLVEVLTELGRVEPSNRAVLKSDTRFDALLRDCVDKRHVLTDEQLLKVLESFVWLNIYPLSQMLEMYEAEFCCRAKQMTLRQMLLAADLWHCLKKDVPQYLDNLYDVVPMYLVDMGTAELVQLLYIIGESRRFPDRLIDRMQHLIMCRLFDLNPEEVGIVCLSLFKSKTTLSRGAVGALVDKAHSLVTDMSDFAVVNVLKYTRLCFLYHKAWLEAMAQEIPLRAPRMGISGLIHVVLACSSQHHRNDDILNAVADRLPSQLPHCRSKDSSKLLWAFGNLQFLPSQNQSFYPSLIEAMRRRKDEFRQFPEHLLTGLHGLAFVSHFPEDLIALALSPDFVKRALTSKLDLRNDLLTLDGIVALELPEWTGPRLSLRLRQEVAERLWTFAREDLCIKQSVLVAESTLQDLLGGKELVCKRMILPHTRTIDLEVHLDSSGEPIPVKPTCHIDTLRPANTSSKVSLTQRWESMDVGLTKDLVARLTNNKSTKIPPQLTTTAAMIRLGETSLNDRGVHLTSDLIDVLTVGCGDAVPAPPTVPAQEDTSVVKLAIQVVAKNHLCMHSANLLGFHVMKRRHLKLAGYTVVDLCLKEWHPILRKSRSERLAYMHCKVFGSLDNTKK